MSRTDKELYFFKMEKMHNISSIITVVFPTHVNCIIMPYCNNCLVFNQLNVPPNLLVCLDLYLQHIFTIEFLR